MDHSLMDEQLSKRNKRLALLLFGFFFAMLVLSTVLLMNLALGR